MFPQPTEVIVIKLCSFEHLSSTAGLRYRSRMHDKSMRGRTHKIKGIAADECQFRNTTRFHDACLLGLDNFTRFNDVLRRLPQARESYAVTRADPFQFAKKSVAMAGYNGIALPTRQRSTGNMTSA